MRTDPATSNNPSTPAAARPHVVLVAPYFFPRNYGGAVQIYDGLLRRLQGYRVTVLTEAQHVEPAARAAFDGAALATRGYQVERVPRLVLHFTGARGHLGRMVELARFFPQTARSVREALATLRPDLVICGATFSTGWLMRRLPAGVPFINYIHGEELTMRRNTGPLDWHLARQQVKALREAPLNLVVSRYSADTLHTLMQVPQSRIRLLPNAIDTERFTPPVDREVLRRRLDWQGRTVLLTIARLIPRKGIDQLLRALARLNATGSLPADWIYCIGGRGPEDANLRALTEQLGLAERVRFLGFISDEELPLLYGAADLFALTNREIDGDTEGFGIVFLEANACGTAVLGGIAGGTGDAIAEGVSGMRVDADSLDQLSDAVGLLMTEPALRERLASAGLERARAQFGLTARAHQLGQIISEVIASR